jgi:Flp pilus assembly pilin Flp
LINYNLSTENRKLKTENGIKGVVMKIFQRGLIKGLLADTEAAVSSEHALLLTLIALAILASVTYFGSTVSNNLYNTSMSVLPFGS